MLRVSWCRWWAWGLGPLLLREAVLGTASAPSTCPHPSPREKGPSWARPGAVGRQVSGALWLRCAPVSGFILRPQGSDPQQPWLDVLGRECGDLDSPNAHTPRAHERMESWKEWTWPATEGQGRLSFLRPRAARVRLELEEGGVWQLLLGQPHEGKGAGTGRGARCALAWRPMAGGGWT